MIRRRRRAALALAVGALVAAVGTPTAHAVTQDEQFIAAVDQLGVAFADGADVPAVGRGVCTNLAAGSTSGFKNPVTAVRGVLSALESGGMTRPEAIGVMQYAVAIYCPEFSAFMPR